MDFYGGQGSKSKKQVRVRVRSLGAYARNLIQQQRLPVLAAPIFWRQLTCRDPFHKHWLPIFAPGTVNFQFVKEVPSERPGHGNKSFCGVIDCKVSKNHQFHYFTGAWACKIQLLELTVNAESVLDSVANSQKRSKQFESRFQSCRIERWWIFFSI